MSALESLLSQYQEGVPETGVFTLDRLSAAEKMRLGHVDPAEKDWYVLRVLQAAVCAASKEIRLEIGWSEITIQFRVPDQYLGESHLWTHLLGRSEARSLHHLAMALSQALDHGIRSVGVEHLGVRQIYSHKSHWCEPCPSRGSLLVVKIRRWVWLRHELDLVRRHCRWCPALVYLNDELVNGTNQHRVQAPYGPWSQGGPSLWGQGTGDSRHLVESYLFGTPSQNRLRAPGFSQAELPPLLTMEQMGSSVFCRAMLALRPSKDPRATLVMVVDGMVTKILRADLGIPGLLAIIEASDLPTDIHGTRFLGEGVLENRAFHEESGQDCPLHERIQWVRDEAREMGKRYELFRK